MTVESKPKLRLREIDMLYALGTLLVILGHSHPNDWSTFPGKWIEFIYTFHMPLFFLIAGYLFAYSDSMSRLGYFKWLKEKALRLLTPYVVLTLVTFVPKYALENGGISGLSISYLLTSFIEPRNGVWGYFWFLPVLFVYYAAFGVFRLIDDWYGLTSHNRHLNIVSESLGLFIGLLLTANIIRIKSDFLGIKDICEFAVYFGVGYLLCKKLSDKDFKIPNFVRIIAVVLFTAGGVASFIWFDSRYSFMKFDFITTFLMLAACWELGQLLKYAVVPCADFIAHNVFTYYIYSWPAQAVVERLCSHFSTPWYITTPAMFAVGVIFPTAVIFIYRKCTFLHRRPIKLILGMR